MTALFITIPMGIILGVLINYLCDVLPLTRQITKPVCTRCQQTLTWKDYLLSTHCPACRQPFPIRRYIVLILMPALVSWIWLQPPARFEIWVGILLTVYCAVVFIIDLEYRAVLFATIYAGLAVFAFLGIALHGLISTLIGGAAGFLIMYALHFAGHLYMQWLAKRRGETLDEPALGLGDVYLSGVLGLGLGWPGIAAGLVIAIFLGGLVGVIYMVVTKLTRQYRLFQAMPYAPFLILAAMYLLFNRTL